MNQWLDKVFFLRRAPEAEWTVGKKIVYYLWRFLILLCAGICLGALALIGEIVLDGRMEDGLVGLYAENGLGELVFADFVACHVVDDCFRHLTLSFL